MIAYAVSIKYMLAGYAIILVVLMAYLVSLFLRWRKLKRDLKALDELNNK